MKGHAQEVERRVTHFEQVCRENGVKLTHQRMEVFRQVAQSVRHPDAETVFRGVRERVSTISLDTVYRTLWLLSDLGLITTLGPGREPARFDANLRRHHHFVCRRCGLISDFYSDAFDELELPEAVSAIGSVEATHVEVEGVCRGCCGNEETSTNRKKNGRRS